MCTNFSPTHHEFVKPECMSLVSTTDLQSRITCCHPELATGSGFTS